RATTSMIRSWSSEYASLFDEYNKRTPTSRLPERRGVLRQLRGRGVIARADSPRSKTGSEFRIVNRFAATQPLRRCPIGTLRPLMCAACSPEACVATSSSASMSYRENTQADEGATRTRCLAISSVASWTPMLEVRDRARSKSVSISSLLAAISSNLAALDSTYVEGGMDASVIARSDEGDVEVSTATSGAIVR